MMADRSDQTVLDHLLEGCQIIGFDYRYIYVNPAVVKQARSSRGKLLGNTMMEVFPGIETTTMFSTLKRCMEDRTSAQLENRFIFPDGDTGWFLLKMEPVPEGVFILSIDITEQKRAELEAIGSLQRVQALREIDLAILSTADLPLALNTVLDKVSNLLDVDAADILLVDSDLASLRYAAGCGFKGSDIERSCLGFGEGYAGRAASGRQTVILPDLRQPSPPFARADLIAGEGFHSAVFVPLIAKGQPMGVLEAYHRSAFTPDQRWLDYLDTLAGQAAIAIESGRLFHNLLQTNLDLVQAYDTTIEGWSRALDLRDRETEGHTQRVAQMTVALARRAGIPEAEIVHIRRGALLHDIGKMGVPDRILLKPDQLTEEEWTVMRQHPVFAFELLHPIEYLRPALEIPHYHHERWDGTGYPEGLEGEEIPLAARLFAVVDVWDAITHDRPYRPSWSVAEAKRHIGEDAGKHFDPRAVELFMALLDQSEEIAA
jgi:HD-GYP domain-containing protein (c-di-GMP phosphodiesterase class II)